MKLEAIKNDYRLDKILIDQKTLEARIKELAEMINADYEGKAVVLIGILKGSTMFMSELSKHLNLDLRMDYIAASSYGDETHSKGRVKILKDLDEDIENEHVIIVEDILDTGNTLAYIKDFLIDRGLSSISIVTLLEKEIERSIDVKADYTGFKIPNEFVVGYGLDLGQYYRNLPYIAKIVPR